MGVHVYNELDTKADMYARIPGDGEVCLLLCDTTLGDIPNSVWQYDASSSASDNFTGGVVKPTAQMGNGRWLRKWSDSFWAGTLMMYGGSTAPLGWLICDGSTISRTGIYAPLFAAISTTYGVGDGSTTFSIPNLQGKFPLGKATAGTGSTLGGTGGLIDHIHAVDVSSTTTSSNGSHNHTGVTGTPSATAQATALGPTVGSGTHTHAISSDGAHTHSVDPISVDSGSGNPPYLVINYIIKF